MVLSVVHYRTSIFAPVACGGDPTPTSNTESPDMERVTCAKCREAAACMVEARLTSGKAAALRAGEAMLAGDFEGVDRAIESAMEAGVTTVNLFDGDLDDL